MQLLVSLIISISFQQVSGWELFENTRFEWQYRESLGLEVEIPFFDQKVILKEGQEITLTGHYLPADLPRNSIIISKMPYASCFFCGGGVGQESVAEVIFKDVQRPFRLDELVTIKGRLKLNKDDYNHLVFMITDAEVVQP